MKSQPTSAPNASAPPLNLPALPNSARLIASLGNEDRQLLLDNLLGLHSLPDGKIAVVYMGRGETGVVRGKTLAEAVAAMRRAIVSGYVVPAFMVTDLGRRTLESEVCAWCEKPITDGQPFVLKGSTILHNGPQGDDTACAIESEVWDRWSALPDDED